MGLYENENAGMLGFIGRMIGSPAAVKTVVSKNAGALADFEVMVAPPAAIQWSFRVVPALGSPG